MINYIFTGGGNGTNTNSPPVAGGLNLGIVVAIVVVLVLSTVLVVVVVIFVILVVRHCKTDKMDNETRTNEAFASLSSRTYELPEITMSVKLEVQDELQKSSQDSKERIYDYANLRLERSEYVVSQLLHGVIVVNSLFVNTPLQLYILRFICYNELTIKASMSL